MLIAIVKSKKQLSTELTHLIQRLTLHADVVDQQKQKIINKVKEIGAISLLLFIVMLAISAWLPFKSLQFIRQLLPFFDALTTGNFNIKLSIKSHLTEFTLVTRRCVQLQSYLIDLSSTLQTQSKQALSQ